MRRYLVFLMALVSMTLAAKRIEKIDLSGEWDFGYGETKVYVFAFDLVFARGIHYNSVSVLYEKDI